MTDEQRNLTAEVLLQFLLKKLPVEWSPRQITEFFLACGVGHAHTSGSMTTAEMVAYVESVAWRGLE
jgi:hypothetical protein